jgi:type IV pilus assembly protein PilC
MSSSPLTFAYRAQRIDGQPLSGTIDAESVDQARDRLETLRLRVIQLEPSASAAPGVRPLRGEDFVTFNQQLAQLAAAGLPLEHGLRLIAQDMRQGKVANTIRQIADDLEKGQPLGQAFEKHASQFPTAYGQLIEAGVRTNNLSGMLLSLGQHLQTISRMRAAMWRAISYPLMVFIALCFVIAFIGTFVLPKFQDVFKDFGVRLPAITQFLISSSSAIGTSAISAAILVIALLIAWAILRSAGKDAAIRDAVGLRLPLVGAVLRRSLVSRWCDAVRIGVAGGMDLPAAMRTAGVAVGSPRLAGDVEAIAARLESGQPLDLGGRQRSLIPATVTAVIELSSRQGALADTLGTLARMYQQQARAKVGLIPAVLTPVLLALLTGIIGFIIVAMFAPFVTLIQSVTGGHF